MYDNTFTLNIWTDRSKKIVKTECMIIEYDNTFTLNIWTDRSNKIVKTAIKLLLKECFDQGLHNLPFCYTIINTLSDS